MTLVLHTCPTSSPAATGPQVGGEGVKPRDASGRGAERAVVAVMAVMASGRGALGAYTRSAHARESCGRP
jgi:hypothetical protein